MRRALAVSAAALIAACSPQGSSARGEPPSSEALAFFHLASSGEGRVSFASSTTEGDAQVLTDVSFQAENDLEVHADTLRLEGARQTPDGVVFDSLEVAGLTASDGEIGYSLDRLVLDRPNAALSARIAEALSDEGLDGSTGLGRLTDYALGSLALDGLRATAEEGEITIAETRFEGLAQGVLAASSVSRIAGSAQDENGAEALVFTVDSWSGKGLDLSLLDETSGLDAADQAAFSRWFADFYGPFRKQYDSYELAGVRADVDGVVIALDRLGGVAKETGEGVETRETLEGLDVTFDDGKELGAQALQSLSQLGYDRIQASGDIVLLADGANDRLIARSANLTAQNMASLQLRYDIGGVKAYLETLGKLSQSYDGASQLDADPSAPDPEQLLEPLVVNGFELKLTDDSLVDRALEAAATSQGSTPDEVRTNLETLMRGGTLFMPKGLRPLVDRAIDATTEFLGNPGTLTVALEPAAPVRVVDVVRALDAQDFEQALGQLNVRIEAEPPRR